MNTKTFNISIPKDLADQADRLAKKLPTSRSELMRDALRNYLNRRRAWEALFAYGKRQAKKLGVTEDDVLQAVRAERGKKNA